CFLITKHDFYYGAIFTKIYAFNDNMISGERRARGYVPNPRFGRRTFQIAYLIVRTPQKKQAKKQANQGRWNHFFYFSVHELCVLWLNNFVSVYQNFR